MDFSLNCNCDDPISIECDSNCDDEIKYMDKAINEFIMDQFDILRDQSFPEFDQKNKLRTDISITVKSDRKRILESLEKIKDKTLIKLEARLLTKEALKWCDYDLLIDLLPIIGLDSLNDNGESILHIIARNGHSTQMRSVADFIIAQGQSLDSLSDRGESALHIAAFEGNAETVLELINRGANVNATNGNGLTSLHLAAQKGHTAIVLALVDQNANINAEDNYVHNTPIHFAALHGYVDTVVELVRLKADSGAINKMGETALHLASEYGYTAIVNALGGQHVNLATRAGDTPLHLAARMGRTETVCELIQLGAQINAVDKDGQTPIHLAALSGCAKTVAELIRLGGDSGAIDYRGQSALHLASEAGFNEVAVVLGGQNVNHKTQEGHTPLHLAAISGHATTVLALIRLGADLEIRYKNDFTALHLASGYIEVFTELVKQGARLDIISRKGHSPLSWALMEGSDVGLSYAIEQDKGFTAEILERKLLAHRFGIKGVTFIAGNKIKLEGFNSKLATMHLIFSLKMFYGKLVSELKAEEEGGWNKIVDSLTPATRAKVNTLGKVEVYRILSQTIEAISEGNSKSFDELKTRYLSGKSIGMPISLKNHTVGLAFHRNRLALCNRGYGCGNSPGVVVYNINDQADVGAVFDECSSQTTEQYLYGQIKEDLKLTKFIYLPQKSQKTGNCAIANTNSLEMALLYLQLEPLIGHAAADELARAIQKARTTDTRVGAVEDYLTYHRTERAYPPDFNLLGQLYRKKTETLTTDKQVRHLIQQWADDLNIEPHLIVPGCEWHR